MCPAARYTSVLVALSMALPPSAMAREHLVPEPEIAARLQAAGAERAGKEARAGVAALSDDESRDLAKRAEALETDPVAGDPAHRRCRRGDRARRPHRQGLQGTGRRVLE